MITKKKLLSIIVPVYKDVAGLDKTITSLISQPIDFARFEIIVANDGADKNVNNVCKKLKIKVVNISPRSGSYKARNQAIKNSSGDFFAFIDAGTIATHGWLKLGLEDLEQYDYVGGPIELINDSSVKISKGLFLFQKSTSFPVKKFMDELHFSPTTNLFVKKTVLDKLGLFDERLWSGGDYEFGDRVFRSKIFSLYFDRNLIVYHSSRDFRSLIIKQRRMAKGQSDLQKYYPDRFSKLKSNFLINFTKMLIPPIWIINDPLWKLFSFTERISVFLIAYYFHFYHFFFLLNNVS